jgi:hypothetical protein
LLTNAPIYSKGCRSSRDLIKKKNIDSKKYIFARLKDNEWIITDGKSVKFDKVFISKAFIKTIDELNNETEKITDEKGIEKAPEIIILDDNQKFKDANGNVIEIETRGELSVDNIYFKVKDIVKGFQMDNLQNTIIDKTKKGYCEDIHYKYFNCQKENNKLKKELFLTYLGILRIMFVAKEQRTNENNIVTNVMEYFNKYTWICNKPLKCLFRPDMYTIIDKNLVLLIEIDENQHKSYDTIEEEERIIQIYKELNIINMLVIRINPDSFKDSNNVFHSGIKDNDTELSKRVNIILNTINNEINKKQKNINTIKLFYDGYNIVDNELTDNKIYKFLKNDRYDNLSRIRTNFIENNFIYNLGTSDQKDKLASDLLGVSSQTIKDVFRANSSKTPCVYLYSVGSAKLLLDTKYDDDYLVCKYGCTDDLPRRCNEHDKLYSKEFNAKIELICFSIIEAKYIFNAESNITQYFKSNLIQYKNMNELIVINKKDIGQIKQHYSMIQNSYIGRYEELQTKISQLEKEIIELNNKILLKDKDVELLVEKHKNELQSKEIEILNYKLKFFEMQNKN